MPLSEHEQRMLEEIENALYADDPKFVSSVRRSSGPRPSRRAVVAGLLVAVGIALMVGGMMISGPGVLAQFKIVALLGFLVMFGAGIYFLRSGSTTRASASASVGSAGAGRGGGVGLGGGSGRRPSGPTGGSAGGGFLSRMEQRFNRRFDDRG